MADADADEVVCVWCVYGEGRAVMIDSSGLGEKTGHGRTWQGVSRLLSGGNETQGGRGRHVNRWDQNI